MHYFVYGGNIAAVEDACQAEKHASAGWQPVSRAAFIAAWEARDVRDRAALPRLRVPVVQSPGDVPPGGVLERLTNGTARFKG